MVVPSSTPVWAKWISDESPDLITVVDDQGTFAYVSDASRRLFGWDPAELVGRHEDELVHPADRAGRRSIRTDAGPTGECTTEFRFLCADGSERWAESVSRPAQVGGDAWTVSAVRATGRPRSEMGTAPDRRGLLDPLTGAANRNLLMDRLQRAIQRIARDGGHVAVLYLDLDRFKTVNDSLGHQAGDAVLVSVATRLAACVRPSETVARLGGDEFVVVVEGLAGETEAREVAHRVLEVGHQPLRLDTHELLCTMSIGVACTADAEHPASHLIGEADTALYRAKENGRDRVEYFDEELRGRVEARRAEVTMLRRVLVEGVIRVDYEPIFDLRSRRVVAAQSRPRICHPQADVELSAPFIDDAEQFGVLVGIGETALREGLLGVDGWRDVFADADPPEIEVHVTARQLAETTFYDQVIGDLAASGLDPGRLLVAVTERALQQASDPAVGGLRALRGKGIRIGLDGFGTNYSTLGELGRLPLDFIKIAPQLVRRIDQVERQRAVVGALVALAHAFGLTVVAQGVEMVDELRTLWNLECDRAQGPLLAPVLPDTGRRRIRAD